MFAIYLLALVLSTVGGEALEGAAQEAVWIWAAASCGCCSRDVTSGNLGEQSWAMLNGGASRA